MNNETGTQDVKENPECVLPHENVKQFLLELIDQSAFKGSQLDFVLAVKRLLLNAQVPET